MKPKKLVAAVPVAPLSTCNWLRSVTDELIVLYTPKNFYAVGQFYERFPQVSDEEVIALLTNAAEALAREKPAQDCAAVHLFTHDEPAGDGFTTYTGNGDGSVELGRRS